MTSREFYALLSRLRAEHEAEFDRWYDTANYPDIKDAAEIGYLLCRFYITLEEPNSATP
jgi:hypothetical protein